MRRTPLSHRGRTATLLVVLLLFLPVATTRATTLLRVQGLEELVDESVTAILGQVAEVRYGYDDRKLHSTWVTLRVDDAVYGSDLPAPGGEYTFKMYGAPVRMSDGTRMFIDGTPDYQVGERYLLLLIRVSDWGFTDTAGMFQGAFRITNAADGRVMAESLAGNPVILGSKGLAEWIGPAEVAAAEAPYLDSTRGVLPYSLLRRAIARIKGVDESAPAVAGAKP